MKLLVGSTALVIALGFGAYPVGPAAAQQIQYACDENGDGYVDSTESRLCTQREFDEIAAGEQALTEEQLSAMSEGQEGMPSFGEFDANGDGEIDREEWSGFAERGFAGASQASGGRMTAEEYSAWRQRGMRPVD